MDVAGKNGLGKLSPSSNTGGGVGTCDLAGAANPTMSPSNSPVQARPAIRNLTRTRVMKRVEAPPSKRLIVAHLRHFILSMRPLRVTCQVSRRASPSRRVIPRRSAHSRRGIKYFLDRPVRFLTPATVICARPPLLLQGRPEPIEGLPAQVPVRRHRLDLPRSRRQPERSHHIHPLELPLELPNRGCREARRPHHGHYPVHRRRPARRYGPRSRPAWPDRPRW